MTDDAAKFWEERRDSNVTEDGRTPYERDYARVVHSAAFRRLQAKTQVLGLGDSDFYRTRLTHSMEVSQIGEGIVTRLRRESEEDSPERKALPDSMLIRTICLAHDLGHPPFGHGGEVALNRCMVQYSGSEGSGFEGNGQTLRIMARLEPYHKDHGMNLTRRTMLGVLKYPAPYSAVVNKAAYGANDGPRTSVFKAKPFKPPKCYLDDEVDIVDGWIGAGLSDWDTFRSERSQEVSGEGDDAKHGKTLHKSLDTSIMEVADDIAYGIHDLEDAIGLGLVQRDMFITKNICAALQPYCDWENGMKFRPLLDALFSGETYRRKKAIGGLVNFLIHHVEFDWTYREEFEGELLGLRVRLPGGAKGVQEVIQNDLIRDKVIKSPNVQQLEFKGQKIVTELFHAFATDPHRLLSPRDAERHKAADDDAGRMRVICDYIAGMTDEYATKRYQQLFEPRVGSVFDRL